MGPISRLLEAWIKSYGEAWFVPIIMIVVALKVIFVLSVVAGLALFWFTDWKIFPTVLVTAGAIGWWRWNRAMND